MISLSGLYGLNYAAALIPLPCGCVVDETVRAQRSIIECPWCAATFDSFDFGVWINSEVETPLLLENGHKPLLRWEGEVYEVVDEHDGLPLVQVSDALVQVTEFEWLNN